MRSTTNTTPHEGLRNQTISHEELRNQRSEEVSREKTRVLDHNVKVKVRPSGTLSCHRWLGSQSENLVKVELINQSDMHS